MCGQSKGPCTQLRCNNEWPVFTIYSEWYPMHLDNGLELQQSVMSCNDADAMWIKVQNNVREHMFLNTMGCTEKLRLGSEF